MGRAPHYRTLASLSRVALLHELQRRGPLTIAELAEATGLHPNTAREHLQRLVDAGFVACDPVPAGHRGRPALRYRTRLDADDVARARRLREAFEHGELLRRLADDGDAPRGPAARQLDVLEDHLDGVGIDAEVEEDARRVDLHDCPYASLARDNPQVCEVHLGLVREVLRQAGGPLDATGLHPLEADGRCTLDLSDAGS